MAKPNTKQELTIQYVDIETVDNSKRNKPYCIGDIRGRTSGFPLGAPKRRKIAGNYPSYQSSPLFYCIVYENAPQQRAFVGCPSKLGDER